MEYRYVQNELRFSYLDGGAETRAYKRDLYDITLASHPHSRSFLDDVTTPSWDHIFFERQPFVPRHLKTLECVVVIMPIPTRILEQIKKLIPPLNGTLHKGQSGRVGVLGGALEYVIEIFDLKRRRYAQYLACSYTGAPFFAAISALRIVCQTDWYSSM